ncbi:snRNA-activating protein complex subunit 3-like isoform X1 [Amphibalanus amphitrite]|uniref:snRNA-activating protein complex subunit 3-like isoform X1 n=2 Tax=Amphibalanus amphitrite TaxID=1232801 RepID=UPI001C9118FA|nr:snRNA-activating protein complex subunit 3-like isoform X1 [Amphibalanus amphitrite]XP_043217519.1 snRNA-activating protein complex subunit 3-like isoform X1 [Amphibalanus amphitrite]XP_043217522.1 snRNA-activating protein complex subunit 3-like isoform X1 [Amphibalanus amphitrite]XP_043217523.1 snRNA-activating protein complex subunit 3-like isoform X1 [Amphibalanus amphitrite]XP_043217524.1 snRNA-activating protein complex subunit 3-like isoform X1 [Amphibalanus amphitrite]
MDHSNLPFMGQIQRPYFCREAINIGEFCSSFSKDLATIMPKGADWMTMAESMDMPQAAVNEVSKICSVDHLLCEGEPDPSNVIPKGTGAPPELLSERRLFPNITTDLTGGWGDVISDEAATKLESLRFHRQRSGALKRRVSVSKSFQRSLRFTGEVRLESDCTLSQTGQTYVRSPASLESLVSLRVYRGTRLHPGNSQAKRSQPPTANVRVFVLNQELLCLGTNQLCDIRDEIRCPNDSLVVNDCSEDPDNTTPITAEEMYPSGFFCIDGVFYVDDRSPLAIDYTEPIQEWATLRRMPDLRRRSMSGVRVSELSVRLGYPYIYVHQGDCRHIMVFSDLRLFRPGVDSVQRCYPRTVAIRRRQEARECHLCDRDIPRWLTMDHELTPTNPTFFCDKCFTDFNYRGPGRTNPVCKFRAYPLAATKGTAGQPPADGGERGTGSGDDQNAGRAAPPARRRVRKVAPKSGGPGGPGDEGQGPTGSGDVQCGSSAETSAAAQDS